MEDTQIIELFWARDESAIRATTNKYGRLLHSIAYHILSNHEDSEECVNDACFKAWQTIPPQKPVSLTAYLGRIAHCEKSFNKPLAGEACAETLWRYGNTAFRVG